jgi:hypothetical protein
MAAAIPEAQTVSLHNGDTKALKRQRKEWPENQERRVKWLSASKAA